LARRETTDRCGDPKRTGSASLITHVDPFNCRA